jgi:hypothetical protein
MSLVAALEGIYGDVSAWYDASTLTVAGMKPKLVFDSADIKDSQAKASVRAKAFFLSEEQATLSDCVASPKKKRYTIDGTIIFQIFVLKSTINAESELIRVLNDIREGYRKKSSTGITYRNIVFKNLTPEDAYHRANLAVNFEYDFNF